MPQTVFVLGAGFSHPAGAPLMREFLDMNDSNNRKAVGELWKKRRFHTLTRLLGQLPENERNIEGLLNSISSAALYGGRISRYRPETLMNFLTDYICQLVTNRTVDPEMQSVYLDFAAMLAEKQNPGIVTLNYDLVIDDLLMNCFGSFDYGFPSSSRYRYFGLRDARTGIPLLKLHGSINWVICSVCRTIWMHNVPASHKRGYQCLRDRCRGKLRPLIVPPMWNKEPYAAQVRLLWELARNLLLNAREIWVIGFSFPVLDKLVLDLVRDSVRRNSNAEVHVHNGPNYDYDSLARSFGRKFSSQGRYLEDLTSEKRERL